MMSLLYWHLSVGNTEAVPEAVLGQLRDHFHHNNLRSLHLTGELLRLTRLFEAHGIPLVPYKGPALAASAYGNIALREFIDLDILVHKQDIPRAKELLASAGYRQRNRLTDALEAAFIESQREYEFVNGHARSVVELHWAVTPRVYSIPLDPEDLWQRLQSVRLGGGTILTFSSEDLLLFLCIHGSKHLWHRLAWICDVAELIRVHKTINWRQLIDRAGSLGSMRMLSLGLFLANTLLGAVLPREVLEMVRTDRKVEALSRQVQVWLFEEGDEPAGILTRGQAEDESRFHPFRVKVRERVPDKLRYCAHVALNPTVEDWALISLPKPLFPLYYVIRPARLAAKYGPRSVKQALR